MLDMMSSLRRIKPTGCVDDYVAGDNAASSTEVTNRTIISIFDSLRSKGKMSANEISAHTGNDVSTIRRHLNKLKVNKLVNSRKIKTSGSDKFVSFFVLLEA